MQQTITSFVGLDIHKDSIAVAVAQAGREAPRFIGTTVAELASLCKTLRRNVESEHTVVVYEAGPCAYGWARHLRAHGWTCDIIAPSRIARSPAEQRLKTDRRDALMLARESRAGNLVSITMPDERDEAIRDLSRAREDVLRARMTARHQLKALLLRHGRAYQGRSSWTLAHERNLASIHFDHPAQTIAFTEYRHAVKDAHERLERITEALRVQSADWRMNPLVKALITLRGFDFIAAVTFVAEIGDLTRFPHPRSVMAYLGLVPSEYSSGQSRRQGSITKNGNIHARRILVESAWSYRHCAHVGRDLQIRQQGQPKVLREISWNAQLRLTQRYRKLRMGRGMHQNKVCIALARELAGFIWDIARHVKLPA